MKLSHLPVRTATGAFILNSGLSKRNLEGQVAEQMHGWASASIPALGQLKPEVFVRLLSGTEVGAWDGTAGAGRSVGPGRRGSGRVLRRAADAVSEDPGDAAGGSLRPTEPGNGLAKDVWLLGTGLTL